MTGHFMMRREMNICRNAIWLFAAAHVGLNVVAAYNYSVGRKPIAGGLLVGSLAPLLVIVAFVHCYYLFRGNGMSKSEFPKTLYYNKVAKEFEEAEGRSAFDNVDIVLGCWVKINENGTDADMSLEAPVKEFEAVRKKAIAAARRYVPDFEPKR